MRFVIFLEIFGVGMGNGDVVVKASASENKLLAPGRGPPEELFSIIGKDAHDEIIKGFRRRFRTCVTTCSLTRIRLALFRVKGRCPQHHALLRPRHNLRHVCIQPYIHALRFQIGGPIAIEFVKMRERDHLR